MLKVAPAVSWLFVVGVSFLILCIYTSLNRVYVAEEGLQQITNFPAY